MAVTDDLGRQRAALTMIHAEPFNAEAPPEALEGDVTPTALHYVRSNFPVPDHDGTLEITGAVETPLALTVDDLRALPAVERVVTLECAGNGRLAMRPLPAGGPGRLRGLHGTMEGRAPARGTRVGQAASYGVRSVSPVPITGHTS